MNVILIGLGGGLGAILRYSLTVLVEKFWFSSFPIATLLVNIIGCLLIGLALGSSIQLKDASYYFFIIGILGSFTTMSAFSSQSIDLFASNSPIIGSLYIMLTISLTILATYIGLILGK